QRGLARQEKASRELLRDRAGALQSVIFMKIPDEGADDSPHIDTVMNKKFLIFARRHRIDKDLWNVLEFHSTTFCSPLARKGCEQFSGTVINFCRVLENVAV